MFNNNEIKDRLQKNYRAGSFKLSNPDKKNWDMAMKVANFIYEYSGIVGDTDIHNLKACDAEGLPPTFRYCGHNFDLRNSPEVEVYFDFAERELMFSHDGGPTKIAFKKRTFDISQDTFEDKAYNLFVALTKFYMPTYNVSTIVETNSFSQGFNILAGNIQSYAAQAINKTEGPVSKVVLHRVIDEYGGWVHSIDICNERYITAKITAEALAAETQLRFSSNHIVCVDTDDSIDLED